MTPLPAGTPAPDFTLPSTVDETIALSDLRARPVVLVFYPADFSPTCTDQLGLYQMLLPEFERFDAALLGISVDNLYSHKAFAADRNLSFPLLADFHPKAEVSEAYGAYNDERGTSLRALFVVDPDGVVSWSFVSPNKVNPGADGILAALEDLQKEPAT